MPDYSLPMTVHQCRGATTQDSKPRVCPCEGVCAPPVGRMASLCTSQKLKRGVGSFVCDCGRERFSSKKLKCQGRQKRREAGQVPPASRRISWPWQHPILFRQNAQAKARQGVRKKSRINACRLVGVPQGHTGPQCGPGNGYTGAFSGISSSLQGFCANGHVTSNTGTSSRFDVLFAVTLRAATGSVRSTAAQLRDFQLCRKGKNLRLRCSAEKRKIPTAQ